MFYSAYLHLFVFILFILYKIKLPLNKIGPVLLQFDRGKDDIRQQQISACRSPTLFTKFIKEFNRPEISVGRKWYQKTENPAKAHRLSC